VTLLDEIREQPEVAARVLAEQREPIQAIVDAIGGRPIKGVMIAARGTSDHAAIYAQYLFGAFHRLPVALAAPALFSVYATPPRLSGWLVLGISQSGASPDVVAVIASAREQGAATVAVTNAPESDLGRAAEFVIDICAGAERAVAATKTYTAELLAIAMLACAMESDASATNPWGSPRELRAALERAPDALSSALKAESAAEAAAGQRAGMEQCVVLGRGFEYATAREWALKLKELAQLGADPYSAADFQHGPLALVEPGYPVLAVATRGRTAAGVADLLARLRRDHGVDLVVISDDEAIRDIGTAAIPVPGVLPEWLIPVASIVPAQLFAYHFTRAKGLDPDRPRWISKVTLTH
jgi:glucosamine--fructose-6-phosphate aminotransferase (isomerizing)